MAPNVVSSSESADRSAELCPICFEVDLTEEPTAVNTPCETCHFRCCKECFAESVRAICNDHPERLPQFKCLNCPQIVKDDVFRRDLDSETLALLFERRTQVTLRATVTLWCAQIDCGSPATLLSDDKDVHSSRHCLCNDASCGFQFCYECRGKYHGEDVSCEEHKKRTLRSMKRKHRKALLKSEALLEQVFWKPCPQCASPIQKNGGCTHMTCSCGHQFCWICLQPYKTHYNGICLEVRADTVESRPDVLARFQNQAAVRDRRISNVQTGAIYAGAALLTPVAVALAVPVALVGGPVYGAVRLARWHTKRVEKRRRMRARAAVHFHVPDESPEWAEMLRERFGVVDGERMELWDGRKSKRRTYLVRVFGGVGHPGQDLQNSVADIFLAHDLPEHASIIRRQIVAVNGTRDAALVPEAMRVALVPRAGDGTAGRPSGESLESTLDKLHAVRCTRVSTHADVHTHARYCVHAHARAMKW